MLSKAAIAHTKQRFVVLFENLSVCESQEINEEYLENIFISGKFWGLEIKNISKSIWMPWWNVMWRGPTSISLITHSGQESPESISSFY